MHDAVTAGWLMSARDYWVFLAIWLAAVLVYGLRRSLGRAEQDSIRESGPVF